MFDVPSSAEGGISPGLAGRLFSIMARHPRIVARSRRGRARRRFHLTRVRPPVARFGPIADGDENRRIFLGAHILDDGIGYWPCAGRWC
jgi:hypothetical protein